MRSLICVAVIATFGCEKSASEVFKESTAATTDNLKADHEARMTRLRAESAALDAQLERMKKEAEERCAAGGPCELTLPGAGSWVATEKTDPITSKKSVHAFLRAQSSSRRGDPALHVRCDERNRLEIYVDTDAYVGSFDGQNLPARLDDGPPLTWWGSPSSDGGALFVSKAAQRAKEFIGKKKLIVQFTPYSETKATATFELEGFDAVATKLRERCKF